MNSDIGGGRLELWILRLLQASVFGVAFSIVLGQAFLGAALILFVIAVLSRNVRFFLPRMVFIVLTFAAIALVATLTGPNTHDSLRELPKLLWYLAIPLCAVLVSSPTRLRQVLSAFALGTLVLSVKILVLRSGEAVELCSNDILWTHAGFLAAVVHLGSMTDGQMLMMGIVVTTGLLIVAHKEKRMRLFWWLVLGLLLVAQLANFKRGSWLVTIAVLALFIVLQTNWRYLFVLMAVVLVFAMFPPVQRRMAGIRREWNVGAGGRLTMWVKLTPGFIKKHPLGIGYSAMTEEMMQEEGRLQGVRVERHRNHLHSNLAQVLVETGWAGLGIYLVWMGWAVWAAARFALSARGSPLPHKILTVLPLLMLIGLLANGLIEYNFGDTELLIVYSVIMGIVCNGTTAQSRAGTQSLAAPVE
jgi:O-antigen ligase